MEQISIRRLASCRLLALALITEKEFSLIKNRLMQDYGVISDLTS